MFGSSHVGKLKLGHGIYVVGAHASGTMNMVGHVFVVRVTSSGFELFDSFRLTKQPAFVYKILDLKVNFEVGSE